MKLLVDDFPRNTSQRYDQLCWPLTLGDSSK